MTDQKDIFSTKEGRWDFVIAISVIALIGYFLYVTTFKDQTVEKPKVEEPVAIQKTKKAIRPVATTVNNKGSRNAWTNDPPYRVSKVKRAGAIDGNEKAEASIITDYEVPKNSEVIAPSETMDRTVEAPEESQQSLATEIEVIKDEVAKAVQPETKKIEVIVPDATAPVETPKVVTKAAVIETDVDSKCAVIVGSFKYATNIQGVVDKLEEMGHPIVKGQTRPGLDYVGVPVDCSDTNAQQKLVRILNQTFDISAWVKRK